MRAGMYLLPWREPDIVPSLPALAPLLAQQDLHHPLIVTDAGIVRAGLLARLTDALGDTSYSIYDAVVPNPTIANIEAARSLYLADGCDCLIALGGGSPIDCAKAAGARIARSRKPIPKMRGELKVGRRIPPLVAIPTTSGSGSETTLAAVVTNETTHEKYAINDPHLIPRYALLDPTLAAGMPPSVTAQTGLDALTHAVEAYIGRSNTADTRAAALEAIRLIDANLMNAYTDGADLHARSAMQHAAYLAGTAFTRAYVGYVHAIAHQLGALYGTPHGLANAILLPHVLTWYGDAVYAPLSDIYDAFGGPKETDTPPPERARYVIAKIHALNRIMDIPDRAGFIRQEDVQRIAQGAYREATPLYPVPRLYDVAALAAFVRSVMAPQQA